MHSKQACAAGMYRAGGGVGAERAGEGRGYKGSHVNGKPERLAGLVSGGNYYTT